MGMPERWSVTEGAVATVDVPAPADAIRAAAIDTFHDAARDELLSRRLGVVGATVAIDMRDNPADSFVLELADGSIGVVEDDDPRADIRITMSHTDLHELFAGGLHLPMKIASGAVDYAGPVRRFLRVTAILAAMRETYGARLAEAAAGSPR